MPISASPAPTPTPTQNTCPYKSREAPDFSSHFTASGEIKPPLNFLDIVADNGGRGHTEMTVMYVWPELSARYGSTGYCCESCPWSASQGKLCFLCSCWRVRIWSHETGSAVPSRVISLILHTQAESSTHGIPATFHENVYIYGKPLRVAYRSMAFTHAGRDCRTRIARQISHTRTGTGKKKNLGSADHEQDWQPYSVDLLYSDICDDQTYMHTAESPLTQ